jgi:Protein of unknown function (DUF3179)
MKARGISDRVKFLPIVSGLIVLSLGASVLLTDHAPTTLPARALSWVSSISTMWFAAPRRNTPFPPVDHIPVVTAERAAPEVRDDYFVVGVELSGESRAYPLNMLSRLDRHVLDDTLGSQPIAVTWCGLCESPVVYSRQVAGKTLTFYVSGNLRGENLVMKDVETGSEWPQMLGEATSGPLKGETLEQLPAVWTDWETWRAEHPETTVVMLAQPIDFHRHDPESSGGSSDAEYFSSLQWGFVRAGHAVSWPLNELSSSKVVNDTFEGLPLVVMFESPSATISAFDRRVGDTVLTFGVDGDGLIVDQTSTVWNLVTGRAIRGKLAGHCLKPIAGIVSHVRAWQTLHPESEIRRADAMRSSGYDG